MNKRDEWIDKDRTAFKWHNMPAEKITVLFQQVGWVGKRRCVVELVKAKPVFDRGPGAQL